MFKLEMLLNRERSKVLAFVLAFAYLEGFLLISIYRGIKINGRRTDCHFEHVPLYGGAWGIYKWL